jgi:citrate lyase subunit beta/citryl-CoA lyase
MSTPGRPKGEYRSAQHEGTPMNARSYLFVPADRPERFAKALATGAGAVVIDLEDAVAPEAKQGARSTLAAWLADAPAPVVLRINAADTEWFDADLALCALPGVAGVMLPKAERSADLARVARAAPGRSLLPLIETALGFDRLRAITESPCVERLVFGSIDFQLDLGIAGDGEELLFFRSQLVLASRLAGIGAPVDGVSTAIDDVAALRADTSRARRLGFGAKLCIHPKQVAVVYTAFMPSDEEVAWARRVIEAAGRSQGAAVAVDGKMVDKPVILRAQAMLNS